MVIKSKIKKGDAVKVLLGKDRGKTGKVLRVLPSEGRVLVEGVQMVKKHVRSKRSGGKTQRVEVASYIALPKVQVVCPACGKATRIGVAVRDGKRARVCKKCEAVLP